MVQPELEGKLKMTTPKKVLMLHGYAQNASIFSKHLRALRKSIGKDIELVFVDAPIVLHPVDVSGSSTSILSAARRVVDTTRSSDPSTAPRAWWRLSWDCPFTHDSEMDVSESLLHLREILRRDRYDGVFGFSQGAGLAALVSALLEWPHRYTPFLIDGEAPHPPFKFCITVAGFKPTGPLSAEIYGTPYSTPTLHVFGRTDVVIIEEWTKELLDLSQNKRVEEHVGGHFVPTRGKWKEMFLNYLLGSLGVIPSPASIVTSQPAIELNA
ncbi:hypothetical protein M405DRAFT_832776 [Rhizopogon salebrosus TDB-379]|nr:hypothetical protein M405DRAFT_832776 [Rhizopogon salebrosus TDB-379]